ncbi:BNR repeat-like domain-containing protein [Roseovarius marisflavi]|uniref:BNR repeat-like domain-containing protein n=1 Tax=Roseovarius marisflavi TaxID=1054996 RepID=A0A1M7A7F0_9RHOB|nr:exo-alpha-sialidase [Roseovarius marisflavi]SHL38674.1 BNR repeat-like domain-containing protein [Roseovarius marisflavi]
MTPLVLSILALAGLSLCLSLWAIRRDVPLNWRFALPEALPKGGAPRFETLLDYTAPEGQAHAPAIVQESGGFSVIWFQGSAEAQPDVDIFASHITRDGDAWQASAPERHLTRGALADAFEPRQLVVTLGNTIQNDAAPGHLYTTAVSVGGWAMAAIAEVAMGARGPVRASKLNLSPILNRSFLVKSPMLAYGDGSHALPAYFEMGPTYGALVRFDPRGRVRDQRRMSGTGVKPIQPMIVPLDATRALAFLRDFDRSGTLWLSRTSDGGQSWSRAEALDMANPSAPVAALALGDGRILMAMNDDADHPDDLRLALSRDEGATWQEVYRFTGEGALRYPMLRRVGDDIALAYSTGGKRGIRVHLFNGLWLAAQ